VEAIRYLSVAAAVRSSSPGVWVDLGRALQRQGRLREAAAAFRKAIERRPDYAHAHQNLGIVLYAQHQLDEAITAFQRALQLKPDLAQAHYCLGNCLTDQGHLDAAVAAYRQAIDRDPEFAEAHCNLGQALQQQGDFGAALTALKQGHELGSHRPDWRYPSAQWLQECQRMIELEPRLPAVLQEVVRPGGVRERAEYAQLCTYKRHFGAAARFWAGVLAADPQQAEDLNAGSRYNAACAAALAGCGQGVDTTRLDEREQSHWRSQALDWLRLDLARYAKLVEGGRPQAVSLVRHRLLHWQGDPDLAGLRDTAAVAKLPAFEQTECKRLWALVQDLLRRSAGEP
jgi:tetratricopeptide (TPR) repeat protein